MFVHAHQAPPVATTFIDEIEDIARRTAETIQPKHDQSIREAAANLGEGA